MCYTGGKSNLRRETIMEVTQRFLKYVSFDTTSSETSDTVPTTAHQRVLGQYLADELAALGRWKTWTTRAMCTPCCPPPPDAMRRLWA